MRQRDLRDLRSRLASLGLSSLRRVESSTLDGLEAVIAILESLSGELPRDPSALVPYVDFESGPAILAVQAEHLLEPVPKGRGVRIMVTMASEAADYYGLVKGLINAGMDVMRVNCTHDAELEWERMIAFMRRANQESGKHCKTLLDLGGPKLRTCSIHNGNHVVRWKVGRDRRGAVVARPRIALASKSARKPVTPEPSTQADVVLPLAETLLHTTQVGDIVEVKDSCGKKRRLAVIHKDDHACVCTCERSDYILSRGKLSVLRNGKEIAAGQIGELPLVEEPIRLHRGDSLSNRTIDDAASLQDRCRGMDQDHEV